MVNRGKGRLFRTKDGLYLIYLPVGLVTDPMFPFKTETSLSVKVSIKIGEEKLIIEPMEKPPKKKKDHTLLRFSPEIT